MDKFYINILRAQFSNPTIFNPFLFCKTCKKIPIINFFNTKKAFISCKCNKNKRITYEEILSNYFLDYLNFQCSDDFRENYKCHKHGFWFKLEFYCENCKLNLCKECRLNHICHIKYMRALKISDKNISEIHKFLDNLDESNNALKKIIHFLLNKYEEYPNYDIKKNINSILNLCKNRGFGSSNILNLSNKNIIALAFLMKKDLQNLKELCLKKNKLNNAQIILMKKLNCYDLEKLNLESNSFTSYSLLTVIENFKKLKEVNFSSNRLYEDYNIIKVKIIPYHSILKLNLSNGIFSNDTIDLLSCLKFTNLEHLNLSFNNLSSLIFIRKIDFGDKENKIKKLIAVNDEYFSIDIINEYIDYLKLNYANLEQLILEEEYPIEYKEKNNLPFKIICFDEGQKTSCLIEEYEKAENESENRLNTLLDYQKRYDNDDNEEE